MSPARRPDGRDFDTAVWLTVRSLSGTPDVRQFNADLGERLSATFGGPRRGRAADMADRFGC
ncbi:hypothetical protein [Actinocrinis sp.]|uniref:hypothetical protein n=1 Tax=Actinocrinis sp. TaxID=1920516 RepID=UPI0039C86721